MKPVETYRGFRIYFDPPPIPVRDMDWQWEHEEFDGPEDHRHGSSASLEQAKADIDWLLDEAKPEPADQLAASSCFKCGLEARTLLHRFCQNAHCPVRDALKAAGEAAQ